MKSKLYLIRHGQSTYNLENRFTGWKDVDLTTLGVSQAKEAATLLKNESLYRISRTTSDLNIFLLLDCGNSKLERILSIFIKSQIDLIDLLVSNSIHFFVHVAKKFNQPLDLTNSGSK